MFYIHKIFLNYHFVTNFYDFFNWKELQKKFVTVIVQRDFISSARYCHMYLLQEKLFEQLYLEFGIIFELRCGLI